MQFSVRVRNARLDVVETTIGVSAILKIRTGAAPVNCAAADSGAVLATINLPSDWMAAASGGVKSKAGTWEVNTADASGEAQHFRIYDSGGSTCDIQGSVGVSVGDLQVDSTTFVEGEDFIITNCDWTDGNA